MFFYLVLPFLVQGQFSVSGTVRDNTTDEILIGAHVYNLTAKLGSTCNMHGEYTLFTRLGDTLRFSFVGYGDTTLIINAPWSQIVNVKLREGYKMEEFTIVSGRKSNFNSEFFTPNQLKTSPSLGSKPDVLKIIQQLPGITSQNEGWGTLIVRGGNPGQNLFLLDNAPLIYVYHLGGFMSVFNPDMINGMEVYKSGFPSKYGGKLSSIISIAQREGNMDKYRGNVSLGLSDVSFAVEGPIKTAPNLSFILTGRKTMTEPLMLLASSLSSGDYLAYYGFHDLNGKISYKNGLKNRFSLNLYYGDDYLAFSSDNQHKSKYSHKWGNRLISSNWKHYFNSGMTVSNTLSYNYYRVNNLIKQLPVNEEIQATEFESNVNNIMLSSHWNYPVSSISTIDYGFQSNVWIQNPNKYTSTNGDYYNEPSDASNELALYADAKVNLADFSNLIIGGRLVHYSSKNYVKSYVEPRVQIEVFPSKQLSFNLSYMSVHQSSHLLTSAGDIMRNEIWVSANEFLPLSSANQFSFGGKYVFDKNRWEVKMDIYYKEMKNLIEFKEGYSFLPGDKTWRQKIETNGLGNSQGAEFIVAKRQGIFTGMASYGFSHTTRQFKNINKGDVYVFDYDQPHRISANVNYKLNSKVNVSALWTYHTGLPYTPAIGRQLTQNPYDGDNERYEALIYGPRNSMRMKNYHRLDLSMIYSKTTKRGNRAEWTFSVYNAYARQNPYYYYYNVDATGQMYNPDTWENNNQQLKLYQISFFPFIPSISYKVYFGDRDMDVYKNFKNSIHHKNIRKNKWLYYEN
jgi:hypothetical protein